MPPSITMTIRSPDTVHDMYAGDVKLVRFASSMPAMPQMHAGDHVCDGLVPQHRKAQHAHALRVGFGAAQHATEARLQQAPGQVLGKDEEDEAEVVEAGVAFDRYRGEVAALRDLEAIIAAVLLEADAEKVEHLRERERYHDERHAAGAQRDQPGDEGDQARQTDRNGEVQPAAGQTVQGENSDDIGADAHEKRMAEANEAAVSQNQVEPGRGQRKYQDARPKGDVEQLAGSLGDQRNQGQQKQNSSGHERARRSR